MHLQKVLLSACSIAIATPSIIHGAKSPVSQVKRIPRGLLPITAIRHSRSRHSFFGSSSSTKLISLPSVRGGGTIEINPDYEEGSDDDEHGSDSSSSDDDGIDMTKHIMTKPKTKRAKSPRAQSILKFLHQNQFSVYALLALIAFRKDILQFVILHNIIPTKVDENGKLHLNIKWSTDGLKLLLVAQLVRIYFIPHKQKRRGQVDGSSTPKNSNETQIEDDEETSNEISIPILPLLIMLSLILLLLTKPSIIFSHPYLFPILTSFALRSLQNPNPDSMMAQILSMGGKGEPAVRQAYLPHLEQHYTFEQLNERYYRDWAAWRKAFPTNNGLQHHSDVEKQSHIKSDRPGRKVRMASLFSHLFHPVQDVTTDVKSKPPSLADTYPQTYNNGTVIILDMTKLDTQATRMESIRDQISFLLHLVENESNAFFCSAESSAESEIAFHSGSDKVNSTNCTENDGSRVINSVLANTTEAQTNATSSAAATNSEPVSSKQLEVIVLLESPGGAVSSYGLAASHLQRLRSTPGITLTICIDTVAASGGYMMACMASPNQLYCAPFAMVGSIGVIGQSLNLQKTLEKYGVRPYVFRGGKMKNPVGMVGDVTKEGVVAMQDMVDRIHNAFRVHVANAREGALMESLRPLPNSKYFGLGETDDHEDGVMSVIDQVANGDVFLGIQAKKLGLVDRLITSDEYISERIKHGARVLKLIVYHRPVTLSSLLAGNPPSRAPHVATEKPGLLQVLSNAFRNEHVMST